MAHKRHFVVYIIVHAAKHPPVTASSRSNTTGSIAAQCTGRTSKDIAASIGMLVSRGDLQPGDQLPTVRALADELQVSTSTVADAWRLLTHHGVITTARRNGTTIRAARADMSGRFWKVPASAATGTLDLSTGTPDTELLPSLAPIIGRLPTDITITSYIDRPVLAELESALHDRWPFPAEAITVLDGALDALDRLITATVSFGDTAVVEDPTFPPILDMLERAGVHICAVPLDAEGIEVEPLRDALAQEPALAILQPRAHNPTGTSMSDERAIAVADLFRTLSPDTWIVEDNHSGDLAAGTGVTIGSHLPDRVVHVHSFSKSHGPDLRIAAVGGAAGPINDVIDRRRLGPSWTSRLIQHVLLALISSDEVIEIVDRATLAYASRRSVLVDGLAAEGVVVGEPDGLNLWVPVADGQRAVVALALDGIGVAAGAPFQLDTSLPARHIRVSIGNARTDHERIIRAISNASH